MTSDAPTSDIAAWLHTQFDHNRTRLFDLAHDEAQAGTPVARLAMDQVGLIRSQREILRHAETAIAAGVDVDRYRQVIAWLANGYSTSPGYLDEWMPDMSRLFRAIAEKVADDEGAPSRS